jgi:hypothetical protein
MSSWLIFSPFSKHSFWNKITEQTNKTNTVGVLGTEKNYYLSVNESTDPKVFLSHWTKNDSQFILDLNPATRELIVIRPNSQPNEENPFQRAIDTPQLKSWLEQYDWVGFGYIIVPDGVDRYRAMTDSVFYTRDAESNLLILSTGEVFDKTMFQPIQHWFLAARASEDLNVLFCHPDILVPSFNIEYQVDNFGDIYYTYMDETFNWFDIALKPSSKNAVIADGVIYSDSEYIELDWGQGSHFYCNTNMQIPAIGPAEIESVIPYETTQYGIKIKNQKGTVTIKYKVPSMLNPSILVNELGIIEKKYIILGV